MGYIEVLEKKMETTIGGVTIIILSARNIYRFKRLLLRLLRVLRAALFAPTPPPRLTICEANVRLGSPATA